MSFGRSLSNAERRSSRTNDPLHLHVRDYPVAHSRLNRSINDGIDIGTLACLSPGERHSGKATHFRPRRFAGSFLANLWEADPFGISPGQHWKNAFMDSRISRREAVNNAAGSDEGAMKPI
jgi:hypothetical protein